MLADITGDTAVGRLEKEIQLPSTAKHAILDFVARELPSWRDHPLRPDFHAEDRLTEGLCSHLCDAAYRSSDMSHIRFQPETGDESNMSRTVDLAARPIGATLIIEGRRSTIFNTILPIECKRLPTPHGTDRDEREYVFSSKKTTGGIQRFKEGYHAAAHELAGIIGYVQRDTCDTWYTRITQWIDGLIATREQGWSTKDYLTLKDNDTVRKLMILDSVHSRARDLKDIEVRHLWIRMN